MVKALKILNRPALIGLFLAVIMPVSFPGGVSELAAQAPDFDIVKTYPADVFGILAVDIDYDNYTDIIYNGLIENSMCIAYGKSDGTFETPAFYLDASAAPMVTAFVNADTLLDILVATWTDLYVMLNNGDRTFSIVTLPGTDNLGGVATGYFNDDAYLDIVAASDKIHLGNGSGGFPQTITLPFIFKTAYVSDFNNDDIHDLVALTEYGDGAIYLNDGDGNFTQTATFSLGEVTLGVSTTESIADFNHDGNADFAFVSPIDYSDSSYITIGYGDGSGGLSSMDTLRVFGTSHSLAIADIDRDNNLDIAVSVSYSNAVQNLEVFLGDGAGNYSNSYPFNWGTTQIAHALATGDIDRDGNPDFVSGTWAEIIPEMHADSMMIAINQAEDEEILPTSMTTTGYSSVSLELTNPGGYMISKYCQTVAGSEYWQLDVDGDNFLDERAVDYNMQNGRYKIVIRPRQTAEPGAIFSAGINIGDKSLVIFKDYETPANGGTKAAADSLVFYYEVEPVSSMLPENGAQVNSTRPTIDWIKLLGPSYNVNTYNLQVGTYYDFHSAIINESGLVYPYYTPSFDLTENTVYYWRFRIYNGSSWTDFSDTYAFYVATGSTDADDNDKDLLPDNFVLEQNYPNPYNSTTRISYSLSEKADVELTVYNLLGQKIKILVETSKPAGRYSVLWDGTDYDGHEVSSGIYFYSLTAGDFRDSKKMVLLK